MRIPIPSPLPGLFPAILLLLLSAPALRAEPLPSADPAELGFSPERLSRLSATLDSYADEGRLPGGVVLIARHGKIACFHAFGHQDIEQDIPMQKDSLFRIASQTKAIVSVAAMILQEEGKLLIGDRVSKYLPEFKESKVAIAKEGGGYDLVPAKRQITIRDLLTHSSGLTYGSGPAEAEWDAAGLSTWYFADRDEPMREVVRRLAALPLAAHPGEKYLYGTSTDVLGAVVEVASGQPLDQFIKERILDPLAMHGTMFYLPDSMVGRFSTLYGIKDGKLVRAPDGLEGESQGAYIEGPRVCLSGGAGLVSSAGDYARFLQMLLNGGELDGRRIISRKTVDLMTSTYVPPEVYAPAWSGRSGGQGFGFGFYVVEEPGRKGVPSTKGEFGWGGAYHSTYWVDPAEGLVVVYMTQVLPADGLDDHEKLRALLYQALE